MIDHRIPHIWIVDDDDDDLFSLQLAAKEIEFAEFNFFDSGQAMLDYANEINLNNEFPRVILMDLNMPIMNGIECMRQFRKIALEKLHNDHIPVIMHSSSKSSMDIHRSYLHGANGYIVKAQQLDKMINDLVAVKRFWCELNVCTL